LRAFGGGIERRRKNGTAKEEEEEEEDVRRKLNREKPVRISPVGELNNERAIGLVDEFYMEETKWGIGQ
jgi:hypothetical protein